MARMASNPQETENLVTFTAEILNGKLHFLYSARAISRIYVGTTFTT